MFQKFKLQPPAFQSPGSLRLLLEETDRRTLFQSCFSCIMAVSPQNDSAYVRLPACGERRLPGHEGLEPLALVSVRFGVDAFKMEHSIFLVVFTYETAVCGNAGVVINGDRFLPLLSGGIKMLFSVLLELKFPLFFRINGMGNQCCTFELHWN